MKVELTAVTKPMGFEVRNMSIEEYLIWCARISSKNRVNNDTAPGLMLYLLDHKHVSPFEMVNISFQVETSRAIAQQILRHRSMHYQEFSQRYSKVPFENAFQDVELRVKGSDNRQSSVGLLNDDNMQDKVSKHLQNSYELYDDLIDCGVATECARSILPLTTTTTMMINGTLRSWIHFLEQRCSEHAQKEVRQLAFEIRKQLSDICPWTAEALEWNTTDADI